MKLLKFIKSKQPFNLKALFNNLFSPKSPLDFLSLVAVTTLIGYFTAGNPIGIIGIALVAILWWWINNIVTPRPKRIEPQKPERAKGLILLLSPYNSSVKSEETLNQLVNNIRQKPFEILTEVDFKDLDLSNSNLFPQIEAVKYHINQKKLKEVWLISTQSYQVEGRKKQGSEITAEILAKYLKFKYGEQLEVHSQGYSIEDGNYLGLYQIVDEIFETSGYKDDVIIADITGGKKMMSVALAMACIPPKRKMQYMDSERDWQGNPLKAGEMQPVLIDVDPILYRQ